MRPGTPVDYMKSGNEYQYVHGHDAGGCAAAKLSAAPKQKAPKLTFEECFDCYCCPACRGDYCSKAGLFERSKGRVLCCPSCKAPWTALAEAINEGRADVFAAESLRSAA